jgi:hypothetical protein
MERSSFRNIDTTKDTTITTVSTTPRESLTPMVSFTPKKSLSPGPLTTECQHHLDNHSLSQNPSRKSSNVSSVRLYRVCVEIMTDWFIFFFITGLKQCTTQHCFEVQYQPN